ncbi:membrane protein [Minicystis rosea]|nr:membrane protein [Minicystis rosea]
MLSEGRIVRASAVAGGVVWLFLGVASRLDIIRWLMLLGPLVAVPLGLGLAFEGGPADPRARRLLDVARSAQPFAAAAGVAAFLVEAPSPALALALVWVALTAVVALAGLARLTARGLGALPEACIDAGLLYLPIGAAWMTASRMRWTVLGFSGDLVTLTGAHFHFAGFAAPLLVGLTGRRVLAEGPSWARRVAPIFAAGTIAGPPLVATGILFSRALELPGAAILASCLLGSATLNVVVVRRTFASPAARGLLNVSSLSLILTMALAVTYASLRVLNAEDALPIRFMARWHGVGNALGFAVCGLAAWTLARRDPCDQGGGTP